MHLVNVDILCAQSCERGIECCGKTCGCYILTHAHKRGVFTRDFGGQDIIAAPRRVGAVPIAKNGFGIADCFRPHRVNGIHLGGVDNIDPCRKRHIHLAMCVCLWGLVAPCHRAEAVIGDHCVCGAKLNFAHPILSFAAIFGVIGSEMPKKGKGSAKISCRTKEEHLVSPYANHPCLF